MLSIIPQIGGSGVFIRVLEIVQYPCTFIPGPKNLFANKLFLFFAATMVWSGVGPYHGMWCECAQAKCICAILTPWAMMIALGLGVITPQPGLYQAYG